MFKHIAVATTLAAATTLGSPIAALADGAWSVCNRTADEIHVAVGYTNRSNQFVSEGWWALRACGGCAQVMKHSQTEFANVYLRAVTKGGIGLVQGDAQACVTPHGKGAGPFTVLGRGNCSGRGFVGGSFKQLSMDTDRNFTTNVRGNVGKATCIDQG